MGAARSLAACLASVVSEDDDRFDLSTLAGKTVSTVEAQPYGWRMRFTDGTFIHVNAGNTFDRVGNYVR